MDVKKLSTDSLKELRALCQEQLTALDNELGWRYKPPVQFQIKTTDGETSSGVYRVAKYATEIGVEFSLSQRSPSSQTMWQSITLSALAAQQLSRN